MSKIRVGISGWRYAPWRGSFYPADLPQRLELSYASRKVSAIEINVDAGDVDAQRFYERHGFKIIGKIQSGSSPVLTPMLRPASRAL